MPYVHLVSSPRVAETAKLWENTFRAVNIALANEMAFVCQHLGVETAEVIEAVSCSMWFSNPGGVGRTVSA